MQPVYTVAGIFQLPEPIQRVLPQRVLKGEKNFRYVWIAGGVNEIVPSPCGFGC